MGQWIKQNLVLVSGIVLPVLLVAGFLVLAQLPKALADPPEYDFLVLVYRYDPQYLPGYQLAFEIREGRLHAVVTPLSDPQAYTHRQQAKLFRYLAAGAAFVELDFDLSEVPDTLETPYRFVVKEAAGLALDKRSRSPDGYTFENQGYPGSGGLLGEIFGMGRRHDSQYVLTRDGAQWNLTDPIPGRNQYGHEVQFLAWVVGGDGPN